MREEEEKKNMLGQKNLQFCMLVINSKQQQSLCFVAHPFYIKLKNNSRCTYRVINYAITKWKKLQQSRESEVYVCWDVWLRLAFYRKLYLNWILKLFESFAPMPLNWDAQQTIQKDLCKILNRRKNLSFQQGIRQLPKTFLFIFAVRVSAWAQCRT